MEEAHILQVVWTLYWCEKFWVFNINVYSLSTIERYVNFPLKLLLLCLSFKSFKRHFVLLSRFVIDLFFWRFLFVFFVILTNLIFDDDTRLLIL